MPFAFPDFSGATRRLVLANLGAFFVLLVANMAFRSTAGAFAGHMELTPSLFLRGELWQPFTYSFIHPSLVGTLFELL